MHGSFSIGRTGSARSTVMPVEYATGVGAGGLLVLVDVLPGRPARKAGPVEVAASKQ
ncbi:hypothetical protein ACIQ6K_16620 [Streptomyces sp. NPDC096354]|uniref:hypothetical protein n=1 Tax=Streptomyces sp. NPDC096354 TaxID=3366088 RepID=UPI00382E51D7